MDEQIREVIAPFEKRGYAIGGTWGGGAVRADALRVRQILRNLIANAIEHGGPDIRIFGDAAGSKYVVSVEDNGPGVPTEIVDQLFARFVSGGEPLTTGTPGLGLAVARLLARAMGGSLEYQRVANRTAFVVSLPLATQADDDAGPAPASDR
jgi:signal transduction histidine kinase